MGWHRMVGLAGSERGSSRVLGMGGQHHLSLLNGGGTVVENISDDSRFLWWKRHIDVGNRCQKCQRFTWNVGNVSLNFFQNWGRSPKESWANAHAWEYHLSLTEQNHRPMLQKSCAGDFLWGALFEIHCEPQIWRQVNISILRYFESITVWCSIYI